jgi:hypothetical protein
MAEEKPRRPTASEPNSLANVDDSSEVTERDLKAGERRRGGQDVEPR